MFAQTWRGNEHFGPAAGEAVQQRLGSDVEVQQSSRAAQLGQAEPGPHEGGLVRQKQGHGVPLLQPGFSLQSSGHLVALEVHLSVGVRAPLEVDEDLVGVSPRCVQEAVQDAVKGFARLVFDQPEAQLEAPQDVDAVIPEVRAESPDVCVGQDGQADQSGEPHGHVCKEAQDRESEQLGRVHTVCNKEKKKERNVTKFMCLVEGGAQLSPLPLIPPSFRCQLPDRLVFLTASRKTTY